MKKIRKNFLGALGLSVVAATTIYAATLPAPGANAVTDTVTVRVISGEPEVDISSDLPEQVTLPDYKIDLSFSFISELKLSVVKLDADGNIVSGPTVIWTRDAGYEVGESVFNADLDALGGYGEYIFTLSGTDADGMQHEKSMRVTYTNVKADVDISDEGNVCVDITNPNQTVAKVGARVFNESGVLVGEETYTNPGGQITLPLNGLPAGTYTVRLTYYSADNAVVGTETTNVTKGSESEIITISVKTEVGGVAKAVIYLYKDGVLVKTIEANPDAGCVKLPIDELGAGDYDAKVEFKDEDGKTVGAPSEFSFTAPDVPHSGGGGDTPTPVPAPDTGGLFGSLDISKADYLATALLVFFVFAVVGIGIVVRGHKTNKSSKKRR